MKMKFLYSLLFAYLLINSAFLYAQTVTPPALQTFLNKESLRHAAVSFKAIDLETGKTLASHNEKMSLTTASTMKLVTTATSLDVLGSNYTYETRLLYNGVLSNGILQGNLYIEGSGDPSLGSEFIDRDPQSFVNNFINAVKQAGIKRIEGDIIALDQLFGYKGVSQKWLWEDLGNAYAPGIYGLSVFDNMCKIALKSGAAGKGTVIIDIQPEIAELRLSNEVVGAESSADDSYVSGIPFSYDRLLYGSIPANRSSFNVKSDIPDPGYFLACYLRDRLKAEGVVVKGEATSYRLCSCLPDNASLLAQETSPALSILIRVINVRSNNHYVEHLYKLLTETQGMDIPSYWKEKGLDASALFMADGSGISPKNAVSAGFFIELLQYMYAKEGKSGAFFQSLPLAGREGTVASFLKGTSLDGKVHVKSGSISNVQAYAGYAESRGKKYAFALIVNNFNGKRSELRKEMGKLLVNLF